MQRQCILSGSRELKQSTSVLSGHESGPIEEANAISKTVMDHIVPSSNSPQMIVLSDEEANSKSDLPNEPIE